jgi:hypothetical protein
MKKIKGTLVSILLILPISCEKSDKETSVQLSENGNDQNPAPDTATNPRVPGTSQQESIEKESLNKDSADSVETPFEGAETVGPLDDESPPQKIGDEVDDNPPQKIHSYTWEIAAKGDGTHLSNYGAQDAFPGVRTGSISWIDNQGNFWIFGGHGYDRFGNDGALNELWSFTNGRWVFVQGNGVNDVGNYGELGVPSEENIPPARTEPCYASDTDGNLWMFGGFNADIDFADLWMFNGVSWAWMSGSQNLNQPGQYGQKGDYGETNTPGKRSVCHAWMDEQDNFWLFGGQGLGGGTFVPIQDYGRLNDLWSFNGKQWRWVAGSKLIHEPAVFGKIGEHMEMYTPGATQEATVFRGSKNIWLYGGFTVPFVKNHFYIGNDLWKFEDGWGFYSGNLTQENYSLPQNVRIPPDEGDTMGWSANEDLWLLVIPDGEDYLSELWRYSSETWILEDNNFRDFVVPYSPTYDIDSKDCVWIFGGEDIEGEHSNNLIKGCPVFL